MTLRQSKSTCPQGNEWLSSPANNLTAAGSTQAGAYAIPTGQDLSIFTTVAASTGARLPNAGVSVGETYVIVNHGANTLAVYPPTGAAVSTGAPNASYSLSVGKAGYFINVGNLQWTACPILLLGLLGMFARAFVGL